MRVPLIHGSLLYMSNHYSAKPTMYSCNQQARNHIVQIAGYMNASEHVILTLTRPTLSRALDLVVAEGPTNIRLSISAYKSADSVGAERGTGKEYRHRKIIWW